MLRIILRLRYGCHRLPYQNERRLPLYGCTLICEGFRTSLSAGSICSFRNNDHKIRLFPYRPFYNIFDFRRFLCCNQLGTRLGNHLVFISSRGKKAENTKFSRMVQLFRAHVACECRRVSGCHCDSRKYVSIRRL